MKEEIPLDDPMYTNRHVAEIGGWSWYLVLVLFIIGWIVSLAFMWIDHEFSLWPLAFFVGAYATAHYIGVSLHKNGYRAAAERKAILDVQKKDRENA